MGGEEFEVFIFFFWCYNEMDGYVFFYRMLGGLSFMS